MKVQKHAVILPHGRKLGSYSGGQEGYPQALWAPGVFDIWLI